MDVFEPVLLLADSEGAFHWHVDWAALLPGLLLVTLYGVGTLLRPRYVRADRHQVTLFALAAGLLIGAVASPLDGLSHELFSAHMTQHLILLVVVPPLLVISVAVLTLMWGIPRPLRRASMRVLRSAHSPILAWTAHTAVLWLWHLPTLYNLSLESPLAHAMEHATFLLVGLLYWWSLLYPPRLNYGISVFSAFLTMMQCSLLGLLMAFSTRPWYRVHAGAFGLSPLGDQQLAGVLMWVPTGVIYVLTALILVGRWFKQMEKRQQKLTTRSTHRGAQALDE